MDNKKIGDFISTMRKRNNMTQKDLADRLGITDKAVSKWERGAGYPDISILKPLADVLGITVNELLDGEASDNPTENTAREIDHALEYADKIITMKENKFGKIIAIILSCCLLLAICTSIIVNIAVNHELSWSLLVTAGCFMGGCLLLPPLLQKRRGIFYSICFLTILIIPFLAIIEWILSGSVSTSGWVWGIGIPVSLTWLIILWLIILLYKKTKRNLWFFACLALILCIPGLVLCQEKVQVKSGKFHSFSACLIV
ncbi:MAG TPA: helix-turn-helix domain-containing protein [Mobilitalea sp.]|nr:helix-turn-helix domain-containing protein [Mobilitalea sp.]